MDIWGLNANYNYVWLALESQQRVVFQVVAKLELECTDIINNCM